MKRNNSYKHIYNQDVYLYVKDIFVDDKTLSIYSVEWYNVNNGDLIGIDQIKVKKEHENNWELFQHEPEKLEQSS